MATLRSGAIYHLRVSDHRDRSDRSIMITRIGASWSPGSASWSA